MTFLGPNFPSMAVGKKRKPLEVKDASPDDVAFFVMDKITLRNWDFLGDFFPTAEVGGR